MCLTINPEGLNNLEQNDGWEEITLCVDSGAIETVIGGSMLKSIRVLEGLAKRRGVKYEIANGISIPNIGEYSKG